MPNQARLHKLVEEQRAFDVQRQSLMHEHKGKYALFEGGSLRGIFETYDEAFREGLRRFGRETPFLISKVEPKRVEATSVSWDLGVMFAE